MKPHIKVIGRTMRGQRVWAVYILGRRYFSAPGFIYVCKWTQYATEQ